MHRPSPPKPAHLTRPAAPNNRPVRISTQPGNFSLVGEGLNVGRDPGEPVTDDYPGSRPYAFTGGAIRHVIVDVSGEPFVDLEREAVAMMARE